MTIAARLVSQPAIIFAMRLAGAALMFLLQAGIARLWSVDLLGKYLLALAAINITACAMPLGFQTVGSYFAAEYWSADNRRNLSAFARRAFLHIAIVFALALPLVLLFAAPIGGLLRLPAEILAPGLIMAAATAITFVNGSILVGTRRPLAAFAADTLAKPLVMAAGFIAASMLFALDHRLVALIWTGALLYLAVALVHTAIVRATITCIPQTSATHAAESPLPGGERARVRGHGTQDAKTERPGDTTGAGAPHPNPLPNGERGRAEFAGVSEGPTSDGAELINETRRWWRFAPPWMIMTVAGDFFFDIDLLLLSPFMSIADLAVFGICTKLFALIAFAVSAVYAVILPDMFAARRQDDPVAFQRKVITANLLAGAIALAAGLAMLFSGPLLALFGPQFAAGAVPLAILCAGLALRSVLGPSALVLSLHDRPWTSLWPVALGLVLLVLLNHTLVPPHGLLGAALAAAITVVAWSALQWLLAFRHTGTDVSIWPWLSRAFARS